MKFTPPREPLFPKPANLKRNDSPTDSPRNDRTEGRTEPRADNSRAASERIQDFRALRNRLSHLDEFTTPLCNNTALLLRANDPVDFVIRKQGLTRQIRNACFDEMSLVKDTVNNLIEEQKKRDERIPFQRNQVVHGTSF